MVKIDFSKVEEKLSNAMQTIFMKKVIKGKATLSMRAVEFYALDDGARPKPQDTVVQGLEELAQETREIQEQERLRELQALQHEVPGQVGGSKMYQETQKEEPEEEQEATTQEATKKEPPSTQPREKITTVEEENDELSPIFLLKKHVDWFKKKKVKDFYRILGTSEEEFKDLRSKKVRTEAEEKRVQDILRRAKPLKAALLKKLGVAEDDALIEKERKKHLTKRFNIREHWLSL